MLPGLADGAFNGESTSSGIESCGASEEARLIAPLPSHGIDNKSTSPCGPLDKFPLEVRNMIYSNVLKYHEKISRPHRFLGCQPSILARDSKHLEVIDAALLRTCKAIYYEAIQILYGENQFQFFKPKDIENFAHLGLGTIPFGFCGTTSKPSSPVINAPYGRLTMIRRMTFKLRYRDAADSLKKVWSVWSGFFNPPEKQGHSVGFPALERLTLDLMDWELERPGASKIRVCPFTRIFSHLHHNPVCPGARPLPLGVGW